MRLPFLLALALPLALAIPARADVAEAIRDHVLPGHARLTEATAALAASDSCVPDDLRPLWHDAFDAWLGVAHLRLGPVEEEGRALAIAFWPDPKGIGAKQQRALLAKADPAVLTSENFARQSVALRGLFALERLLWPTEALTGDYPCALIHATADDLAATAQAVQAGWENGFADGLLHPGPGLRYLTETETRQALFTTLITGLEFNADQRLGRPLGSFDKPRPERAEARASGRSLRNIALSLMALRDLAHTLHADLPRSDAGFATALQQIDRMQDPALQGVAEPQGWLKADILAQQIRAIRDAALAEIGPALGVGIGFNAADGD